MKPFDFHKHFTIKNAYTEISTTFDCDDKRDRIFNTPVECSFGLVVGFYYDETEETIFLIVKNDENSYKNIFDIDEDDAYLCAKMILDGEYNIKINRDHELYVGEKVYDANNELVCEIIEITPDKVMVSQEKYLEHNKIHFDLDCEEDGMEWDTDADALYQFVPDMVDSREGMPVCYEHTSIDYPYFSPYLYENLYAFEVDNVSNEKDDGAQVKITIVADKKNLAQHLRDLADALDEDVEHYETAHLDAEIDWEWD